jgi:hypothetical protein
VRRSRNEVARIVSVDGLEFSERYEQTLHVLRATAVKNVYVNRGNWCAIEHRSKAANRDELYAMVAEYLEDLEKVSASHAQS